MKILFSMLIVFLTVTSTVYADIEVKGSKFNFEYTTVKLDAEFQKNVCDGVMKDIGIDVEVIYSEYQIKDVNAFAHDGYIVMAQKSTNEQDIRCTFLHELGHIIQERKGIDLVFFSAWVGEEYSVFGQWRERATEMFAENYKWYMINTLYVDLLGLATFNTDGYDDNFGEFLWLYER